MLLASKTGKWVVFISAAIFLLALSFLLVGVFSGRLVLPQSFRFGLLAIHYYGIIMALAVAAAFALAIRRAPRFGLSPSQAEDLLFWTVIGGFIGARLYHVLSSAGYYWQNPADVFKVWNGGLSIYGAVLGGIITVWVSRKIQKPKTSFVSLLDWLVPSVLLGQIIGRFGNFFNYEAYGYPTGLPWKMFVPENFRPLQFLSAEFFHPWFLYEALGNSLILFFLMKFYKPKAPGQLVLMYLLLYNLLRFALEFLRIDSTFIGPLRLNAIMSLLIAAAAAAGLMAASRRKPAVLS